MLSWRLRVFFTEVPVQCEFVAESSDEFPAVETAFDAQVAAVQCCRNFAALGFVPATIVVILLLLQFEVQVESTGLSVVENNLPLIELRAVVVQLVITSYKRPNVVAIAARVVGQK